MKINKYLKSLFNLSYFLSKYLWIYFLLLAIAALFPLSNYISSATQATLLILCFPLLIIKNLLHDREIGIMAEAEKVRFLKQNIIFPFKITLADHKFIFEKLVKVSKKEFEQIDSSTFQIVFAENDILVIDYYRPEIGVTLQVKYLKKEENDK